MAFEPLIVFSRTSQADEFAATAHNSHAMSTLRDEKEEAKADHAKLSGKAKEMLDLDDLIGDMEDDTKQVDISFDGMPIDKTGVELAGISNMIAR